MDKEEIFHVIEKEYREACLYFYETRFGEKINVAYTIKNNHTGEVVSGSTSGCRIDKEAEIVMKTIRRMMLQIFGEQVKERLEAIREEERAKEKEFFKENPQYVTYVTDIR